MYKILVVDDEAIERESIKRVILAAYPGQCAVETASNGKQAITTAEAMRADIVIMDIEMPGINGLDAAQTIREMLPRCRIIIVTAYERFQYAQLAISFGAEEYLLKPVPNAELLALLTKTMAGIDADLLDSERREALDQLAREQFVLSVISGYASEASLESQLRELDATYDYGFFCITRRYEGEDSEDTRQALIRQVESRLDVRAFSYEYDNTLLIAALAKGAFRSEVEILDTLSRIPSIFQQEHGFALEIGLGHIATSLPDLRDSYSAAQDALAACAPGQPVQMPPRTPAEGRHKGLERRLYGYLLEKELDGALRCVDTMLDTLFYTLRQPEQVASAASKLLTRVAGNLQRDAHAPVDLLAGLAPLQNGPLSQQEMTVRMRALLTDWMQALDAQPVARMQRVRVEIERYIREHYTEDLSVKQVARAMHYSEPYFSKLFSRCFHKNFVTYLTDIRMQAARTLLLESMDSVRDISLAAGFADANYFAKVFRKTYGISPTEYRRVAFAQGERGEDTP